MMSSNWNIFRVTGEFPAQRPVTQSFDVFFDLRLKKGWVNDRELGDLRRHRAHSDVIVMSYYASWICPDFNSGLTLVDQHVVENVASYAMCRKWCEIISQIWVIDKVYK